MGALDRLVEKGFTVIPYVKKADDANIIQMLSDDSLKYAYSYYLDEVARATDVLNKLNQRKADVIGHELVRFVNAMAQIKDIDYRDNYIPDQYKKNFSGPSVLELQESVMRYYDFLKEGSKSLFMNVVYLNKKSTAMLNNAKINRSKVEILTSQMDTEIEILNAIIAETRQMDRIFRKLLRQAMPLLEKMEMIVENQKSWLFFQQEEKNVVLAVVKYMQLLKGIVDMAIVNEDGSLNSKVKDFSKQVISELEG